MRNTTLRQELNELIKNTEILLSSEQPKEKDVGQVWQIIPKNKYQEPKLGVIIKKVLSFNNIVILKNIFDSESIEGNNLCLFESDETALKTPVLAVYWKPFYMNPFTSNYGRYLCNLSTEQVEQIIKAKSSKQYPKTIEGEMFRAECNYQANYLGFCNEIKLFNEISKIWINLCSITNEINENLQASFAPPAILYAASDDEQKFNNFQDKILDELTDENNTLEVYKDCKTLSEKEFSIELNKDIGVIFFDKDMKPIDYIESQNKLLTFKLDNMNKSILDCFFIGFEEKPQSDK